ncbi:MAG: sigma-70 family RNA polymerase sigma factor [Bacteroidales bacterium]
MAGINQIEFDQIFLEWYYPLRNSMYYKTGNMQAAEDLVQDTFLKIWERKETINPETVKSFMYKIANNLFLNKVEHEKVSFRFVTEYSGSDLSNSPDFELEMKDFDRRLQNSLADLDEKSRSVFLMNRIDELTYAQIADNLGLSVKAVEKRISKAIAFLKERLDVKI